MARPRAEITPACLRVLRALDTSLKPMYGLEIAQLLGVAPGTVYPLLRTAVENGWADTRGEGTRPDGPVVKRLYWLTALGQVMVSRHKSKPE